jgi:hypothetical protein
MRPRFSLRWLLVSFTVLAVIFYLLFVRPTQVAQSFVDRVNAGNYWELFSELQRQPRTSANNESGGLWGKSLFASVSPRSWSDIFQCRRRFSLRFEYSNDVISRVISKPDSFWYVGYATPLKVHVDSDPKYLADRI